MSVCDGILVLPSTKRSATRAEARDFTARSDNFFARLHVRNIPCQKQADAFSSLNKPGKGGEYMKAITYNEFLS